MSSIEVSEAEQHAARVRSSIRRSCDIALLTSAASVAYATGYSGTRTPAVTAATSFGGPFAIVGAQSTTAFVGAPRVDAERFDRDLVGMVEYFDGLVQDRHQAEDESYFRALDSLLSRAGAGSASVIGLEARTTPATVAEWLRTAYPGSRTVDVEANVQAARRTKSRRELALIRRANEVADLAHARLAELAATPDVSESEAFADVRAQVEQASGGWAPVEGEIVSGPRTSVVRYPGGPTTRIMRRGDPVIMDLSARVGAYWFDCTNTHLVGGVAPSKGQARLVDVTKRAFDSVLRILRPGVTARDVWRAAAEEYDKTGTTIRHYFGHQIGLEVNEPPRIVPFDDSIIEAGMVFEIEPGAYEWEGGTFGCRFEKTVQVGENGPEIINRFAWGI